MINDPTAHRRGDAIDLTHGRNRYGGPGSMVDMVTPPAPADQSTEARWYEPAHTLGTRSVIVSADTRELLSAANSLRKFVQLRNLGTVVVYVGGPSVTTGPIGDGAAGWPVNPGEGLSFDAHEFDGDLWAITAAASPDCDVRVLDPQAGS